MKGFLQKTIQIAKLRNSTYSKPDGGNEFKFFGPSNASLTWENKVKAPKNQGLMRIKYPNKLQAYFELRVLEEEEQEKLEKELESKRDTDKKKDSKVLDYIFTAKEAEPARPWQPKPENLN